MSNGHGWRLAWRGGTTCEKLEILRKANAIYLEETDDAGLYEGIWQAFFVLRSMQNVGVMADGRPYDFALVLRRPMA